MNKFRNIGYYIDSMLKGDVNKKSDYCSLLNFSSNDLNRLCDGRIILTPNQLEKTAFFFKKSVSDIISYVNLDSYSDQVHCRTKFSDSSNCDKILDIIDAYIDVKESV